MSGAANRAARNSLMNALRAQSIHVTGNSNSEEFALPPPPALLPRFYTTGVPNGEITDLDPTATSPGANPEDEEDAETAGQAPGTVLKVKHLDAVLDAMTGQWNMKPTPPAESSPQRKSGKYDAYAFTVIRKFTPVQPSGHNHYGPGRSLQPGGSSGPFNMTKLLEIHSAHLKETGSQVIGQVQGVSWTAKPLRVSPQVLLSWLPELQVCAQKLGEDIEGTPDDSPLRIKQAHLDHLLTYLTTEYARELETLASLLAGAEITFDLLWALYVPRKTILHVICPTTSEPRACRLLSAEKCQKTDMMGGSGAVQLDLSGLTLGFEFGGGGSSQASSDKSKQLWRLTVEYLETEIGAKGSVQFGYAPLPNVIEIPGFSGTKMIKDLGIYPLKYYAGPGGPDGLKERLIERGRRWSALAGAVHHLAYKGIAYQWKKTSGGYYLDKYSVDSRIMIDRKTFADSMPTYDKMSYVTKTLSGVDVDRHAIRTATPSITGVPDSEKLTNLEDLTDDVLMLAPPNMYGFSLSDKTWLEFALDFVEEFTWNTEAYENLVIPGEQKSVLTTLIEAHSSVSSQKVDDFVTGKGQGLVINLYGNPGTGKSLTAEAMSEYLHKPLYVVGAGDLGTSATKVDSSLAAILKISASWGAVVLIDEADVFLEERALHHIERNAMVAVFLRHLEYFRGILFLTTNRVRVFDEAFQSRIHLSLRYHDLSSDARRTIWRAFLRKAHAADVPDVVNAPPESAAPGPGNVADSDAPKGSESVGPDSDAREVGLTREELRQLSERKINGRQIKNVVKTAHALAAGRSEVLGYRHLEKVLDMMEVFDASHSMYQ